MKANPRKNKMLTTLTALCAESNLSRGPDSLFVGGEDGMMVKAIELKIYYRIIFDAISNMN